ncbi:tRNA (adenosine(37)-N6)-threonylcarbamoyltransferase complex dimerization subunit type 1 TsaB [Chitinophaga vietnamensis]|uniref:tRNA (adenosine(37)-N6)-threonylcarbamoyltransferase complex dimerization subunit type 1 TsaB n=1 Tax=Chitinophaga vietnamensis TaxID=2593957 RepID=UPI0011776F26|nr:tRNA (adenosine(37)-N6)-threonylcarbamoyltransferase complex dimerization subunit type 1 TsaB [Chitinophaga vietnamensis]
MALILNIDTATVTGSVSLARDGKALQTLVSAEQKDHAATITLFVQQLLREQGLSAGELDAVAVSAGPGSYTGLRVGVATAKGLCYAWNKPLIAVSTLKMMAQGLRWRLNEKDVWYCPMLDARRQEVFTAMYDDSLHEVLAPQAMVLDAASFAGQLEKRKIYFFGDGSGKWAQLLGLHPHAMFADYTMSAADMAPLSEQYFHTNSFADLAYFSPFYLKPFYFPKKS